MSEKDIRYTSTLVVTLIVLKDRCEMRQVCDRNQICTGRNRYI